MGDYVGHPPRNNGAGGAPLKYTKEFIETEADAFLAWMEKPTSIYFKEFAFERGYSSRRFSEWSESNIKFAETMDRVREWQEFRVAKGSLLNELNGSFAKFFMSNVSGWSDKTETKHTGDVANPIACLLTKANGKSKELVNEESEA